MTWGRGGGIFPDVAEVAKTMCDLWGGGVFPDVAEVDKTMCDLWGEDVFRRPIGIH